MVISKKNQLVGVDVGSNSIKLVEIEDTKKGRFLKNFGIIGLPHNAIVEGSIKEPEIVASAISTLIKNLKINNKNISTSISGFSVIVKTITVNTKESPDLDTGIKEEAEQYIPFDIDDVNLDYEIIKRHGEKAEGEEKEASGDYIVDAILVAAKKDMIDEYVDMFHLARLNPMIMDLDAFAVQNAFEMSEGNIQGSYALINIGAEELGINAIKDGISIFTRDSSFGGKHITEDIMSAFNVPYEEAEKIKLGGKKVDDTKKLQEIFSSNISIWVDEIKKAIDFILSTYPDEKIERLYVCGGSCRIPGLIKYLESETEIPVSEINPFKNLNINEKLFDLEYLKYMAPQAAVAVGLALRSIGDK